MTRDEAYDNVGKRRAMYKGNPALTGVIASVTEDDGGAVTLVLDGGGRLTGARVDFRLIQTTGD